MPALAGSVSLLRLLESRKADLPQSGRLTPDHGEYTQDTGALRQMSAPALVRPENRREMSGPHGCRDTAGEKNGLGPLRLLRSLNPPRGYRQPRMAAVRPH